MKPKEVLEKIQNQPESTRKAILWGATIFVGIVVFFWWFLSMRSQLEYNQRPTLQDQTSIYTYGGK